MSRQRIITSIAAFACFCASAANVNVEEGTNQANDGSMTLIDILPRWGGDSTLDHEDFEDINNTYAKGIASLVVIPAVFFTLSLLLCPIWTICRCCKCCCCKKKKPKKDITKCQIYFPLFALFAAVTTIMYAYFFIHTSHPITSFKSVMAGIGYKANTDFSGSLLHNKGEGESNNLFSVAQDFLSSGSQKVAKINNISIAMEQSLMDIIDEVKSILNDTTVLTAGPTTLIAMLNNISASWTNYTVSTTYNDENYAFECEFCTTFGSKVDNITGEIEDQIGPIFDDLNATITSINASLISSETEILLQITNFTNSVDTVADKLDDAGLKVENARPEVEKYNNQRQLAYNIMFAIPLFPIFFILFGCILKKPCCFTCSYITLWFSCTLMWVLLGIHLPIAVLLHDSCAFLDVIDANVTAAYPNNTVAEIFDACMHGEKLVHVLGLGDSLNFSGDIISWESLGNITDDFEFEDLVSFEDDAASTDFTTFYEEGNDALEAINNFTMAAAATQQTFFTRNNVSDLDVSLFYTTSDVEYYILANLTNATVNLLGAEATLIAEFNDTVFMIRADVASVTEKVEDISIGTQSLVNSVDNATMLLDPLFLQVDILINETECGFIGDAYATTKAVMCESVLGALSRIVVAMFVIAVLSVFGCLISVKLVRRVEWLQVQKKEDKENKLRQSFQPNKPTIVLMQPQRGSMIGHGGYQPGGNIVNPSQGVYYNQNI